MGMGSHPTALFIPNINYILCCIILVMLTLTECTLLAHCFGFNTSSVDIICSSQLPHFLFVQQYNLYCNTIYSNALKMDVYGDI